MEWITSMQKKTRFFSIFCDLMEVLMIKFQVELERGEAASERSLECSWVDTSLRDREEEYPSLSSWDGDQVKTFVLLFCCLFLGSCNDM